jgi:hypothetical protein
MGIHKYEKVARKKLERIAKDEEISKEDRVALQRYTRNF